jgi:predicted nucleotidyltransferase
MVDRVVKDKILAHFATLSFWKEYWKSAAVAVVGSTASEQSDQFSDFDILVFVPRSDYDTLYRLYEKAIQTAETFKC